MKDLAARSLAAFRDRLQRLMAERGIKPRPLSEKAGLSPSAVRDMIVRHNSPRLNSVAKIAQYLGVPVAYLTDPDFQMRDQADDAEVSRLRMLEISEACSRELFALLVADGAIGLIKPEEFARELANQIDYLSRASYEEITPRDISISAGMAATSLGYISDRRREGSGDTSSAVPRPKTKW